MTKTLVPALLLAGASTVSACRQNVYLNQNDAASNGADGQSGETASPFCAGGQTQDLGATLRFPDVIVALDRSTVMQAPFGQGTRLDAARNGLFKVVMQYQYVVRFGYLEFPAPAGVCNASSGCCAGTVLDPVLLAGFGIQIEMGRCDAAGTTCNSTQRPTADALVQSRNSFGAIPLDQNSPDRYVLLVTGGDPNCSVGGTSGPCDDAQTAAVRLNRDGVRTHVVGIADDASAFSCLDRLAVAGETSNGSTPPLYHLTTTPTRLDDTLSQIVFNISQDACHLDLRVIPPDPDKVALVINGARVSRGGPEGWQYDDSSYSSITLHGDSCQALISGSTSVQIKLSSCSFR